MKKLLITGLCLLLISNAIAQGASQSENPGEYFNKFQQFLYTTPNADSAFYFAKKLGSNNNYALLFRSLLHESFAQAFIQRKVNEAEKSDNSKYELLSSEILQKMISDTTALILETVTPIYLWKTIQDNKNNVSALDTLANKFLTTQLYTGDIYKNKAGRYGILIYQLISDYPALKPTAEKIFTRIYSDLKNNQITATDSTSRADLDKRAWYRYLFAYTNYLQANQTNDTNKKVEYLKTAYDYSPDLIDKNRQSAYFYDMVFLFAGEEKPTFKNDYLTLLTISSNDKVKILSTLLEIALVEPEYKNQLKNYYNSNNTKGRTFDKYWIEAINSNAKAAPSFLFFTLDQKLFSSKQHKHKWILIDFWGTWCAPCREEHPEMQKFYDSTILYNSQKISFLTIACRDSEEKVRTYMNENHFTFPVALSDGKIENIYPVQGYPTKILITPQGKYVIVPFGVDWVNFVELYCDLKQKHMHTTLHL